MKDRSITSDAAHPQSEGKGGGRVAAQRSPGRLARAVERQVADIMAQVAPRYQAEKPARGVVSVLFVTIAGFVALCEEIEPPEVSIILETYLQTVIDSVGKYLGTVQSTMGDTVMATWNTIHSQPDHAVLALSSAVDVIERIDDVNGRLRLSGMREITYNVGVNTGDALVRHSGMLHRDNDVVGDTVNVARLLSAIGSNCSILIGEGTRISAGEQISADEMGMITLPGKHRAARIFRLQSVAPD